MLLGRIGVNEEPPRWPIETFYCPLIAARFHWQGKSWLLIGWPDSYGGL